MVNLTKLQLNAPYLIMVGDMGDETYAKTGLGIVQWRPDLVVGQLRFTGCKVDLGVPDMSVSEAANAGVRSLVIGVAPIGGIVPDSWWHTIEKAAHAGLDIVCGLHLRLNDYPTVVDAARASGARLVDVRVPPANIPIASGKKRTGKRVLMVGTDCAIGKKYTALALNKAVQKAGMKSTFRATGQTGIMLAGEGIPIDAVVADFIAGAAELLSPDNESDHWDVIEGQGSLFHPAYSGVTLGLMHGSQPDAFVLCHDATRNQISGWEHKTLPSIQMAIEQHVLLGRHANSNIRCIGISVNTSKLSEEQRQLYLSGLKRETDLPCVDPLINGCNDIIEYMHKCFPEK